MAAISGLIRVMEKAARKAGGRLRRDFGEIEHLQVSRKGPADFVSKADIRSERTLYDELLAARPDWGFVLEEAGTIEGAEGMPRWIIDPLDGTSNFLHGIPHFAISIAVQERKLGSDDWGDVTAAVIYNPDHRRDILGRKDPGCVVARWPLARVVATQPVRSPDRYRSSLRGPWRLCRMVENLQCNRSECGGYPPLRRCLARPRMVGGWAIRRVLGKRVERLGHRCRLPDRARSGRVRVRLSWPHAAYSFEAGSRCQ